MAFSGEELSHEERPKGLYYERQLGDLQEHSGRGECWSRSTPDSVTLPL